MHLTELASRTIDYALEESNKTLAARQSAGTAAAGSARQAQQSSASTVLSTLVPAAIYGAAFFILFLFLRRIFPRIYRPRTFLSTLPPQERTPNTPKGLFNWFAAYFRQADAVVLNAQETLDGYLFLRLLRVAVVSCLVGILITWPILIPINVTGAGEQTQLNLLTWSNVASPDDPSSYNRYYAHVVCAWLFFGECFIQGSLHMLSANGACRLRNLHHHPRKPVLYRVAAGLSGLTSLRQSSFITDRPLQFCPSEVLERRCPQRAPGSRSSQACLDTLGH